MPLGLPSARHPIGKLLAMANKACAVMEMGIMDRKMDSELSEILKMLVPRHTPGRTRLPAHRGYVQSVFVDLRDAPGFAPMSCSGQAQPEEARAHHRPKDHVSLR